jgi:hypothetical protein
VAQLAEQHGHELAPTAEAARVPFGLVLLDGRFELQAREKPEDLTENTAYSIHGWVSFGLDLLWRAFQTIRKPSQPSVTGARVGASVQEANLDKSGRKEMDRTYLCHFLPVKAADKTETIIQHGLGVLPV